MLLTLIIITASIPLFAQYDFFSEQTRKMVVSTASPDLHNYYVSMQRSINPFTQQKVFYMYSQTPSIVDKTYFTFHLGTGTEEALETIRTLRHFLMLEPGTSVIMPSYRETCKVWVFSYKRYGNFLALKREGMAGFIIISDTTLALMEDALLSWDDEADSAFAKKELSDKDSIQAEIDHYVQRLYAESAFTRYSPSYYKLFKKRIKEYRADKRKK